MRNWILMQHNSNYYERVKSKSVLDQGVPPVLDRHMSFPPEDAIDFSTHRKKRPATNRIVLPASIWGITKVHRQLGFCLDSGTSNFLDTTRPIPAKSRLSAPPPQLWRLCGDAAFSGVFIITAVRPVEETVPPLLSHCVLACYGGCTEKVKITYTIPRLSLS